MDTDWFQEALAKAGTSQAELARQLGLAPSAVSRMVKGDRQMKLQEAVQVAAFLGVSQEEVLRRAGAETPAQIGPTRRGRPPQRDLATSPLRDSIPILGGASEGEQVGYTPRPANLAGVRDAYAIYMMGEEQSPRYEQGWLLHVHPFKPPMRGRDVVVRKNDQTLLIGQFVGWEDDTLVLRHLNPDQTFRIPRPEISSCHLIVGVDQEG